MKANELMIGDWVQISEPCKYHGAIGRIKTLIDHKDDETAYFKIFLRSNTIHIGIEDICSDEVQETKQLYFIEGYRQAEKDLELSWKDIPKILSICENLKTSWWFRDNEQTKQIGEQPFWEEVLKRFKEK